MATFRKRGEKWYAEVRTKSFFKGKTLATKKEAKAWAARIETEQAEGVRFGPNNHRTLGDAIDRYTKEVSPKKPGARWELIRGKFLQQFKIYHIYLNELSPQHFAEFRDQRLTKVKPASVKRELNFISSILKTAMREWNWINHNPLSKINKPQSPPPREKRVSNEEIAIILNALKYDEGGAVLLKKQQTAVLFLLAIESAMRTKELATLKWDQVFLDKRYVQLTKSKNGDRRQVALSTRAIELFKKLEGLDHQLVFTMNASVASSTFYKAKTNAGLNDLNLHDTRREAISRLAKKLPVIDLAKMTGHRDIKTLLNVYYKPEISDIADLLD